MAKKKDEPQATQDPSAGAGHTLPITILRQYVRDLSFESPASPASLSLQETPEMEVDIDVQARKMESTDASSLYEVVLRVRIITTASDSPVFLVELEYGTLVAIEEEVPEDRHHPILFIEVPRFAYPFASQIVTNACVHGGFPPVLLKPIDFHSMYMERHKDEIAAAQKEAEAAES